MYQIRGSCPKFIKNSYNLKTIQFLKWAQVLNTHFSKEDICGQRYTRQGSASLIIREIQIKTTVGYHIKSLKNGDHQDLQEISDGEAVEKREPPTLLVGM